MFEKALIRGAGDDYHVDFGLVAETLLFYQSTHLLLDMGSLGNLIRKLGANQLLRLLDRDEITASYIPKFLGVKKKTKNGIRSHEFIEGFIAGPKKHQSPHKQLRLALIRANDDQAPLKILKQIENSLEIRSMPSGDESIPEMALLDCSDGAFVKQACQNIIEALCPSYDLSPELKFELVDVGGKFLVGTDLDFTAINETYHRFVPSTHSTISPEYILAHILNARGDTYFAADYMAEIVTSPANSAVIQQKHFDFLRRRVRSEEQHDLFEKVVLDDARTVREVINSGERSIDDLMQLLDDAEKFREWLHTQNPDAELIKEYYAKVTKDTWVDKLPGKSMRFALFTGGGMLVDAIAPTAGVATAAGLSVSAVDSFCLDKLIKGWRPNQFIEGPLSEFVTQKG